LNLPDVQQDMRPNCPRHLHRVGVQNVSVPLSIQSGVNGKDAYEVKAKVDIFTDLEKDVKGVSMSRFVRCLDRWRHTNLNNNSIKEMLEAVIKDIGIICNCAYAKFNFDISIVKESPETWQKFPEFYNCTFEGRLGSFGYHFFQIVKVPYASYCPCSAELSEYALKNDNVKGFPHAQRSLATVTVQTIPPRNVWLENVIWDVEKAVVNIPYPIIKRKDEQFLAIRAAKYPMFVEDAAREIADKLDRNDRICDWLLKCEHFESIHTHEAVCILSKGVPGGLSPDYFLV